MDYIGTKLPLFKRIIKAEIRKDLKTIVKQVNPARSIIKWFKLMIRLPPYQGLNELSSDKKVHMAEIRKDITVNL